MHQQPWLMTNGSTAFFKVSNVATSHNIRNHGASTKHVPELNLHGFGTRLGHRVGRLLGSLFSHDAEFQGRQVVTLRPFTINVTTFLFGIIDTSLKKRKRKPRRRKPRKRSHKSHWDLKIGSRPDCKNWDHAMLYVEIMMVTRKHC